MWIACRRLQLRASRRPTTSCCTRASKDRIRLAPIGARARLLPPWRGTPAPAIARPSSHRRRVRAMFNNRTDRATSPAPHASVMSPRCRRSQLPSSRRGAQTLRHGLRSHERLPAGRTMTLTNTCGQARIRSDRTALPNYVAATRLVLASGDPSGLRSDRHTDRSGVTQRASLKIGQLRGDPVWASRGAAAPGTTAGGAWRTTVRG